MPIETILVRAHDGSLRPATAEDAETLRGWRVGQAMRVSAVQVRPRSLVFHKRYWGGLLELAMHYWEPGGGLVSASEVATLEKFARWLDRKGGNSGAVQRAGEAFLAELRDSRASHLQTPEASKQALHEWIKLEAGYCRLLDTPAGVRKVPRETNFNAMDQDEFEAYYRAAFGVVWRFILSRAFASEAEAENAIAQLLDLG